MENLPILHPEYIKCSCCGNYEHNKSMTHHFIDMNEVRKKILNLFCASALYKDSEPDYAEYYLCPNCELQENSPIEVKYLRKGYIL